MKPEEEDMQSCERTATHTSILNLGQPLLQLQGETAIDLPIPRNGMITASCANDLTSLILTLVILWPFLCSCIHINLSNSQAGECSHDSQDDTDYKNRM